jgi:hypothetical protein
MIPMTVKMTQAVDWKELRYELARDHLAPFGQSHHLQQHAESEQPGFHTRRQASSASEESRQIGQFATETTRPRTRHINRPARQLPAGLWLQGPGVRKMEESHHGEGPRSYSFIERDELAQATRRLRSSLGRCSGDIG